MIGRFIQWLKKSGIRYEDDTDEIIDSLNPFDAFIEDPHYPFAKLYRENVLQGLDDTFNVLVGNHFDDADKKSDRKGGRIGILDILIFPLITRRLIAYSRNFKNNDILRFFARLIGGVGDVIRCVLGIALTIMLSPIVLIFHALLYCKARQLKNDVLSLQITETDEPDKEYEPEKYPVPSTTTTLYHWMDKNKVNNIREIKTDLYPEVNNQGERCDLFLMSPEEGKQNSDDAHLRLYRENDELLIYYIAGERYELKGERFKDVAMLFNKEFDRLFFNGGFRRDGVLKNNVFVLEEYRGYCVALLKEIAKRGHIKGERRYYQYSSLTRWYTGNYGPEREKKGFKVDHEKNEKDNPRAIEAFKALNIGGRRFEEDKKLDEIRTRPKRSREAVIDGMLKSSRNESSLKTFASDPLFDRNLLPLIFSHAGFNLPTGERAGVVVGGGGANKEMKVGDLTF